MPHSSAENVVSSPPDRKPSSRTIGLSTSLGYRGAMLIALPSGSVIICFGAMRVSQVCPSSRMGGTLRGLLILAVDRPGRV